VITRKLTKEEY